MVDTITMPVPLITSIKFGGPNNDILFVLSANALVDFYVGGIVNITRTAPYGHLFMIHGLCDEGTPSYRPVIQ